MLRAFVRAAVVSACALCSSLSVAAPAQATPIAKLPPIETFQLTNGLRVAYIHVEGAPVVAVQVWYRAGSKDEPRDRRGTARMFEQLMFEGSTHVPAGAHARYLTGVGGVATAQADEDSTHFVDTVPAEYLDLAIHLEADRMRDLVFRKQAIDDARATLAAQMHDEQASAGWLETKAYEQFLAFAYTKHPYAWTADGEGGSLDAITADDLKKFYDAYYEPNNALLVVAGDATLDEVKTSAEKWFGPIEKAADPPRPAQALVEPEQTDKRREVTAPGQIGLTLVGWHIPAAKDKDVYALQLASLLLGSGESSRLKHRLKTPDPKTKHVLALDGGVRAAVREDPGVMIALGAYGDAADQEPVEAAIFDEVQKLGAKGPAPDELRKAKNQVQAGFVFSLQHVEGLAEAIGRSWILAGDPTQFVRDVDAIEHVSAADIARVVKQYLAPNRAVVVVIPPPPAQEKKP